MDWNELYDLALAIASQAHKGQRDKSGNDYILHPLRVAERCHSPKARIAALLHDTLEDTGLTAPCLLEQGLPAEIVDAVLSLTRREGEPYDEYVRRAAANPIGREVKRADLEDNMDIRRLNELSDTHVARLRKYLRAWHYLQSLDSES